MSALETAVRTWFGAKLRGDREAIVAFLSTDPAVSAIGTDHGEWAAGPAGFAAIHGDAGPIEATMEQLEVHERGDARVGHGQGRRRLR